jgi:L-iditol 2-dehydrogenase
MKVCALIEGGAVDVLDRPEPHAAGDIVKVRLKVVPMCTEFKDRRRGMVSEFLGHEGAGVVADAGTSKLFRTGDRVVVMPRNACGRCRFCAIGEHIHCPHQRDVMSETGSQTGTATYADYLIKPDRLLIKVPDSISLRHASLACCGLGPGFNANKRIGVGPDDTVLVSGCGPVGLGAILNAVHRGARVIALEPSEYRAGLARRMGAEIVVDPRLPGADDEIRAVLPAGATCGIETSGLPDAAAHLLSLLQPLGRLALLAWGVPVQLPPIVPLGVAVHGCWHWNHLRDEQAMWTLIREHGPELDAMVTHEFSLTEVSDAMDLQDSGACGKVLMHTQSVKDK